MLTHGPKHDVHVATRGSLFVYFLKFLVKEG